MYMYWYNVSSSLESHLVSRVDYVYTEPSGEPTELSGEQKVDYRAI